MDRERDESSRSGNQHDECKALRNRNREENNEQRRAACVLPRDENEPGCFPYGRSAVMKVEKTKLYICDRQRCKNCHDVCRHTTDIEHAKNADYERRFREEHEMLIEIDEEEADDE